MTQLSRPTRREILRLLAGGTAWANSPRTSAPSPPFGVDTDGRPIRSLAAPETRVVVTVFVATDCPISNRYVPEILRLSREFNSRGAHFWLVYPNPGDDAAAVRAHTMSFGGYAAVGTLITPAHLLIRQAGVHVTPEAALFRVPISLERPALWHGRIDDRYVSIGTQRSATTHRDLEEALRVTLSGGQPAPSTGHAVGCAIVPRTTVSASRGGPAMRGRHGIEQA